MIIPLTRTPSRISYSSRLYNVPPFLLPCRKLGRNEEEMLPSPVLGMVAREGKGRRRKITKRRAEDGSLTEEGTVPTTLKLYTVYALINARPRAQIRAQIEQVEL